MSPQIRRTLVSTAAALTLAAIPLATLGAGTAQAGQGSGNPTLTVSPSTSLGSGKTTVTVTGKDYLVPPHAAGTTVSGGVYVFFGWVDTAKAKWGPSGRNINNTDGNFGTTYIYPGEQGGADTTDSSPSIGYVAFTKGEAGAEDSPFMSDNGDWTLSIEVPGSSFRTTLPGTDETKTTDCLKVKCGVFTIGAHGKPSFTNEKFAPVSFVGAATTTSPTPTATPKPTTVGSTSNNSTDPDAPGDTSTTSGSKATVSPLPKTGIGDESSASVVRPVTPIDGQTVAIGVRDASDSGTGGGLALFGVAALVALVMALTASLFLRYRREG